MGNWIEVYRLGRLTSDGRLEWAAQHRRLVRSRHFGRLPLIVKSLLLLFTYDKQTAGAA